MTSPKRSILVPYDFTPLSEYGLEFAIQIARLINNNIILIHVITKPSMEDVVRKELEKIADKAKNNYKFKPQIMVLTGKVINVIKEFAMQTDASLVIMKTAGPKGMQRYFGSRAVKIMYRSKIPFIVVQERPKDKPIENVVLPIDFRQENKEKLKWINFLYKYHETKIHLIRPSADDYKTRNNIAFAKHYLDNRDIKYDIIKAPKKANFVSFTLDYSKNSDADLILVMMSRNIDFIKFLLGLNEQRYISNVHKIPVFCLNPMSDINRFGGFN